MDLRTLIDEVERNTPDDPLDRLVAATVRHDELTDQADQLLDHFVGAARDAGCSWTSIGEALGVTKQAAQQRHGGEPDDDGPQTWFRRRGRGRRRFQRFTERARDGVVAAQVAARELNHNYVGTEHVLLGLFADRASVAAKLLAGWSVTRDDVVAEIEARIGMGAYAPKGHIPFTPRAKQALELTLGEAGKLGHNYIGTEHILLGLLGVDDGLAAQILGDRQVSLEMARIAVIDALVGRRDERPDSSTEV